MTKAIYVTLLGGLGNQMFQYAVGRSMADDLGVELVLDPRHVIRKTYISGLAIDLFNIRARFLSPDIDTEFPLWKWRLSRAIRRRLRPCLGYYHEANYAFDDHLASHVTQHITDSETFKPLNISGFWQSYRYFDHNQAAILTDLRLKKAYTDRQEKYVKMMRNSNSVGIHIRRGDYLSDPKALSKHGVTSLKYFRSAVALMQSRVTNPRFFIFSDDPQWVNDHLPLAESVNVSSQGFDQEIDLTLMSHCDHQIISNSSFSWWGGYLNNNVSKQVVAPKPWFDANIDASDLCPPSWHGLSK